MTNLTNLFLLFCLGTGLAFDESKFNKDECSSKAKLIVDSIPDSSYIFSFAESAKEAEKDQFITDLLCSNGVFGLDLEIINGFSAETSKAFIQKAINQLQAPYAKIIENVEKDKEITIDDPDKNFGITF